jgi:hypothetical protein
MEPTTPPASPKFLDRPLVREAIRIGIAVLVAFLASKGIKLPSETFPVAAVPGPAPVVVVNVPGHDGPAK